MWTKEYLNSTADNFVNEKRYDGVPSYIKELMRISFLEGCEFIIKNTQ